MDITIQNPKRRGRVISGREDWYPFYPGFSTRFAEDLIVSAGLSRDSRIADPWNGSGTTTAAARKCGYASWGFDLNPVMIVVAKARLISTRERPSLLPIARDIVSKARLGPDFLSPTDPLLDWFQPRSVVWIRNLDHAVQTLLVEPHSHTLLSECANLEVLSDLSAFFYTALFRTVRSMLDRFRSSNPTWISAPRSLRSRVKPSGDFVLDRFIQQTTFMVESMTDGLDSQYSDIKTSLSVASSEAIPLGEGAVELVLSSPPYCTRLDYAVASRPELAMMGYSSTKFELLRKQLIGTTTVPKEVCEPSEEWGQTCNSLLSRVRSHCSKASATYYYKNHLQYFYSIWKSIVQIARILTTRGACVLVVQDSYYKDIHTDLPRIITEMADSLGLPLVRKVDFQCSRTLAGINPAVRSYRSQFDATESVLWFTKS